MRTPIFCANWKMNKTLTQSVDTLISLMEHSLEFTNKEVVIFPNIVSLAFLSQIIDEKIILGSQNVYFENVGAFTGETSVEMIEEYVSYVLVGHSERRNVFGENNEIISKKMKKISEHDSVSSILCIGEHLDVRENGDVEKFLEEQISSAFIDLVSSDIENTIIAYEPCWAISDGKKTKLTPTAENIEKIALFIRGYLEKHYGSKISEKVRILYGGSVHAKNAQEFMSCKNIDGLLIGGASLEVDSFVEIVNF